VGLLNFFSSKDTASQIEKYAKRVNNKRAQAPDRYEAIQALANIASPDAVRAILPRFSFYIEPSISDHEEKDRAFDAIVAVGEAAVEPVKEFLKKTDSISWPLKIFDRLLPPEEVIQILCEELSSMDVEYERDPQKKVQILTALGERQDPKIGPAVQKFIKDVNETARFNAVKAALFQQNRRDYLPDFAHLANHDESLRIRIKIFEVAAKDGWKALELDLDRKNLTPGFLVDPKGVIRQR